MRRTHTAHLGFLAGLIVVLAAASHTSCGGGPTEGSDCSLTCRASSSRGADVPSIALSCGTQPVNCQFSYDQFSRVSSMSCTFANGRRVTCSGITYNDLGQMTGGSCSGEGQTCRLPR
jgi:hypothetical protein